MMRRAVRSTRTASDAARGAATSEHASAGDARGAVTPPQASAGEALVDAWRALLERHARTHGALERALKPYDLSVSEFEVLERLAHDSGEQRRMQEVGEAVHLSQSALSRVVGRLEHDGLASRGMCKEDRRGIYVCITDAGRSRYEAARPAHRSALAEALG
jgi:DNA-binding MarR family transcriptional regulator